MNAVLRVLHTVLGQCQGQHQRAEGSMAGGRLPKRALRSNDGAVPQRDHQPCLLGPAHTVKRQRTTYTVAVREAHDVVRKGQRRTR